MNAFLISLALSIAEAYLSKRLGGLRVKIDRRFAEALFDKRTARLTAKEQRIKDLLAKIRPAPQKGALARNTHGDLGLITSTTKVPTAYPGGRQVMAWVGIQLGDPDGKAPGGPWSSTNPTVVGHVRELQG